MNSEKTICDSFRQEAMSRGSRLLLCRASFSYLLLSDHHDRHLHHQILHNFIRSNSIRTPISIKAFLSDPSPSPIGSRVNSRVLFFSTKIIITLVDGFAIIVAVRRRAEDRD
ncbi:unnamed protein product [Microthlaspi erraticum]|uniref:Uncharacterized protein n=1 Tax=Microthlaspi erraticum TaxID=1685480 RepID=A0A6D2KXT6_9BRAS|nr:unnamed protein product [Microthlaspi erraticum]